MNKKCPICSMEYDKQYEKCLICNEALTYDNNSSKQSIISRPSIVKTPQNNTDSRNNLIVNSGVSCKKVDSGNETYEAPRYNDSIAKDIKSNIFSAIIKKIGDVLKYFLKLLLTIFRVVFIGRQGEVCNGIIVSSMSTDINRMDNKIRLFISFINGMPYSKNGEFTVFQICEVDSAGRPIKNKAHSIKVFGKITSGQLQTNNEVQVIGYRDKNNIIVAKKIINLNSNVIINTIGSIDLRPIRSVVIVLLIGMILMSFIAAPANSIETSQVQEATKTSVLKAYIENIKVEISSAFSAILELVLTILCVRAGYRFAQRKRWL